VGWNRNICADCYIHFIFRINAPGYVYKIVAINLTQTMRILILAILFLSINSIFGQNKAVKYNEINPEFIIAFWENNGTSNNSEFNVPKLNQKV